MGAGVPRMPCDGGHQSGRAVELLRSFYKQSNPNAPKADLGLGN